MFRRRAVHSLIVLAALLLPAAVRAAQRRPKRGFVADGPQPDSPATCSDPGLLSSSAWYYDYNVGNPYVALGCSPSSTQAFQPMYWCTSAINSTVPPGVNTSTLLGFNEPNDVHECSLTPAQAAAAWRWVMHQFPTSELVSPATAGNGVPWLTQFMGNCTALYGDSGCRLSYVAVHDYSCNASHTMQYLSEVHAATALPVWLTEFACGDHSAKRPLSDQMAFVKALVPQLDAAPHVHRYAWMSARQKDGDHRMLLTGEQPATLTPLGQLYNAL